MGGGVKGACTAEWLCVLLREATPHSVHIGASEFETRGCVHVERMEPALQDQGFKACGMVAAPALHAMI